MNVGKNFEDNFKKSVPDYSLIYRLPDSAQSFGGSNRLRFSSKNPFDYLLWDSQNRVLFALELKTVADKSISFERTKEDKGVIHYHQIRGLNQWNQYPGIVCGFIIEFRYYEKTIFIEISEFNKLLDTIQKKSFRLDDLDANEIKYIEIGQVKARTRFKYDIDGFLKTIKI